MTAARTTSTYGISRLTVSNTYNTPGAYVSEWLHRHRNDPEFQGAGLRNDLTRVGFAQHSDKAVRVLVGTAYKTAPHLHSTSLYRAFKASGLVHACHDACTLLPPS